MPLSELNKEFYTRVQQSFAQQEFMRLLNAQIVHLAEGEVTLEMPFSPQLTQQHGYTHAGVLTTLADVACGYAAHSAMPDGSDVLSVEYKVNFLRPGRGERFIARAKTLKSGRTLSVCQAEVFGITDGNETLCATMQATMICLPSNN